MQINVLIKTTLMKSLPEACGAPRPVLVLTPTVIGSCRDAHEIEVPGTYTLLR